MIEPIDLGIPGLTNIEQIGSGGNAVVYRARQGELDRNVVVKVLLAVDAESTRRRFDRERRAMGRLSQTRGIAPLYGSGFTPAGQPYLLMPYYPRGSLQNEIELHGPMAPEHVRAIGVRIARAVDIAHRNGVLHRDLKPANILMTSDGQPDVADFGIAHIVDDSGGTTQALTLTPLYTAPEVFDGVDSGAASDVYSLGALLYAVANGRPAFSDPTGSAPMFSLMRRINEEPLPPLPASVPAELRTVIATAMSKDPRARYPTAGALADALEAMGAVPEEAGDGKRSRVAIVAGAVAVLAVIGVATLLAVLRASGDDSTALTPTSVAIVDSATPGVPSPPVPIALDFEEGLAREAAGRAFVDVEAFSCTGATRAQGIVLDGGLVLTDESVLSSPWYISVVASEATVEAEALTSDRDRGLAMVLIAEPETVDAPNRGATAAGTEVLLVDGVGTAVRGVVQTLDGAAGPWTVDLADDVAIQDRAVIIDGAGQIVGFTDQGESGTDFLTLELIEEGWNRIPPVHRCSTIERDLGPDQASSAKSAEIRELLLMQRLSNAFADEDWDLVRRLEPGKASLTDQQFIDGWRPLEQGFIFPVDRTVDDEGVVTWRIGLIGHESWDDDLTTLFCVTWMVDAAAETVVQTNEDTVAIFGPQPGQPRNLNFVDPGELRSVVRRDCPAQSVG